MDQRPQEAVAAIRQRDAQAPDPLTTGRLWIEEQAQALEIHLGHLARWRRRHTDRIAASPARFEAQAPDEAFQGGVRDVHAALAEQLLHARHLQVLLSQPGRDLLAAWLQPIGLRRCPRPRRAHDPTQLKEPHHLVLGRRRSIGGQPELLGGVQVLLHRLTRDATGTCDRALRLAHLPTTNDFDHLHATQLPITHPAHLVVADMVMNRAAGGLMLRGDRLAYCFVVKPVSAGLIVTVNDNSPHIRESQLRRPTGQGPRGLDRFTPHLVRRWQEGCNVAGFRPAEVKALGYRGSKRTVGRFVERWRKTRSPRPVRCILPVHKCWSASDVERISKNGSPMFRAPAHRSCAALAATLTAVGMRCTPASRSTGALVQSKARHQPAETNQAADVWSRRFRSLAQARVADVVMPRTCRQAN